jgi:hypothetical protein
LTDAERPLLTSRNLLALGELAQWRAELLAGLYGWVGLSAVCSPLCEDGKQLLPTGVLGCSALPA